MMVVHDKETCNIICLESPFEDYHEDSGLSSFTSSVHQSSLIRGSDPDPLFGKRKKSSVSYVDLAADSPPPVLWTGTENNYETVSLDSPPSVKVLHVYTHDTCML